MGTYQRKPSGDGCEMHTNLGTQRLYQTLMVHTSRQARAGYEERALLRLHASSLVPTPSLFPIDQESGQISQKSEQSYVRGEHASHVKNK